MSELEARVSVLEKWVAISCKNILDTKECAMYLGMSVDRVHHLTQERAFPYYISGKKAFYKKEDIEAYMTRNKQKSQEEIEAESMNYILKNR